MPNVIVREHSSFTNLTLLLFEKVLALFGTAWDSFVMALTMAMELSGSATMLTVTSLALARTTGMSLEDRLYVDNSLVTVRCSTTTE
jgi:hypothetical protein